MDDQQNNLFELIDGNESLKRLLSELGVFAVNYKDNRVLSNQLWKNWGYTEEEMSLDNDWMNNIHPEDKAETLVKRIHLQDHAKNDMQREIYRYRKKDGDYAWIISRGKFIAFDNSGAPVAYIGAEVDISALKQREFELIEAKQKAEKLAKESETLLKIGATIASSLDINTLSLEILKEIKNLVDFDMGSLLVLNNDDLEVIISYEAEFNRVRSELASKKLTIEDRRCFHAIIITYKKSLMCNNIDSQFGDFMQIDSNRPAKSVIGVPLVSRKKLIGMLILEQRQPNAFSIEEYDTISKISDNIAVSVDNAILHEKLSSMALTDSLTNVSNRHGLHLSWQSLSEQAIRHQWQISFMVIDIDHFKIFNDKYGHKTGDEVLRLVANVLKSSTRGSDLIARFGGEEFVVILPNTADDQALLVAQKIQASLTQQQENQMEGTVTVSIGITTQLAEDGLTIDCLFKEADEQMYLAKDAGRNKVQQSTTVKKSQAK